MTHLLQRIEQILKQSVPRTDIAHYFYGNPSFEDPKSLLLDGIIAIEPIATNIQSVTTGLDDSHTYTIAIHVKKYVQLSVYTNAYKETAAGFMTSLIEGRNDDGSLLETSIAYILRKNIRMLGVLQPSLTVEYETDQTETLGGATATITLEVVDHHPQTIL